MGGGEWQLSLLCTDASEGRLFRSRSELSLSLSYTLPGALNAGDLSAPRPPLPPPPVGVTPPLPCRLTARLALLLLPPL
jgi:hypothetical protein